MALVLTEEQQLLRDSAREFVSKSSSLKRIRALRDSGDGTGFSRDLWREMAQLGWVGMVFPESYGGAALGYADLVVVLEELGRGLMPEPMLSTVLLGGTAILLGGNDGQRQSLLPAIAEGKLLLTMAAYEAKGRYQGTHVETRAERAGKGWVIRGTKTMVPDGHVADRLVVSARTTGGIDDAAGISLFVVDAKAAGVTITRQSTLDSRNAAMVDLNAVQVSDADLVGTLDEGAALLGSVLDRATVGLCAEMLGGMSAALEMTLNYLKTRKQFGVLIGTFQALKHRAATMYIESELARSAVMGAAIAVDASRDDLGRVVSLAKARCADAYILIANEGVQMHGGIGMTDEHDIGFFIKRARVASMTFGDAAYHRNRYAEAGGY